MFIFLGGGIYLTRVRGLGVLELIKPTLSTLNLLLRYPTQLWTHGLPGDARNGGESVPLFWREPTGFHLR